MLNAVTGKLIVALDDCLYTLRSKCSGWLYHDAGTGTVSVQTPPFVSSNPQETNFGFLAKVVPTTRSLCSDDSDQCAQEIVQELAAQKLDLSSVGQLIVGRAPLCNEIGPGADASVADQTHLSYLDPADYKGCPKDAFILIGYPDKIGPRGQQVEIVRWAKTPRLRFPKSQWGPLTNTVDASKAKRVGLMPVSGADNSDDPCFELRMIDATSGELPSDAVGCDIAVFRSATDTTPAGWKAEPKGLSFHPLDAPVELFRASGLKTATVTLPNYPTNACGDVFAVFEAAAESFPGASNVGSTFSIGIGTAYSWPGLGSVDLANCIIIAGSYGDLTFSGYVPKRVTSASVVMKSVNNGVTCVQDGFVRIIGYLY